MAMRERKTPTADTQPDLEQAADIEMFAKVIAIVPTTRYDSEDIVDAEIIEGAADATPGTDLVVRGHYVVKTALTPAERLATPANGAGWRKNTSLSAKVSHAGVGGAADVWEYIFHSDACPQNADGSPACTHHDASCPTEDKQIVCTIHTHVGQKAPAWLLGRLGKTLRLTADEKLRGARDERETAEWLVKAATNAPVLAKAFEDAWWDACGVPIARRTLAAATFDALDLLSSGVGWSEVRTAITDAAFAGSSRVSRAYEDAVASRRREAANIRRGRPTQGQVLQGAHARLEAEMNQNTGREGWAA